MAERPHIVIIAHGDGGWLGGRQYAINLVRSLLTAKDAGAEFDLSVLVKNSGELTHYEALKPRLRECADYEARLEDWTLPNKIRWWIKRVLMGWTNPRFEELLVKMGATFAYPMSSKIVPSADWISDFQYHHYPDRMSPTEILVRRGEFAAIIDHAQRIVLSSHCAERDCHDLFPASQGRTDVLQFRVFSDPQWTEADPQEIVRKYHLPDRFALVSNWLLPTKNHNLILDALAKTPASARQAMHIVCTGDIYDFRNPGFYNQFLNRIHALGLHHNVSVLGVIPKADQIQLLRASTAYLQPSLFEGWNTGVEEARMFGKTMLVSDIPVHREQAPPRSTFFDPNDPSDLAAKLQTLFSDESAEGFALAREQAGFEDYRRLQIEGGRTLLSICSERT